MAVRTVWYGTAHVRSWLADVLAGSGICGWRIARMRIGGIYVRAGIK